MSLHLATPGRGIHFHVLGVAVLDVAGALALAWAGARYFNHPILPWILGVFVAGVVAHRLFGIRTAVDRALFG